MATLGLLNGKRALNSYLLLFSDTRAEGRQIAYLNQSNQSNCGVMADGLDKMFIYYKYVFRFGSKGVSPNDLSAIRTFPGDGKYWSLF